jgi:hypothetical protein
MFPEDVFMNTQYTAFHNYREEADHGPNRHHRSIPDTGRAFGDAATVTDTGGVAHPARIADPGRISANSDKKLDHSERSSVIGSSGSAASAGAAHSVDGAQANSAEEAQLPFAGYDALSAEEISAALTDANRATIKKVRRYERKFANRSRVLEKVVRVHRERRAMQPASAAPAYQRMSARSGASARRVRRGRGQR